MYPGLPDLDCTWLISEDVTNCIEYFQDIWAESEHQPDTGLLLKTTVAEIELMLKKVFEDEVLG